ncbi:hypothetical protein K440DRAFT_658625 [Wilcoxina mikolae CBS 423.85]|nr:hypothetical protein K440DRAFT_658625 [Wilcoxina mikolae CBS 423.85]
MDPLSTCASGVAFVGIAGQLLQGIKFLIDVFSAVQNAPDDVRALRCELDILRTSLKEAQRIQERLGPCSLTESLELALNYANSIIIRLKVFVEKHEPRARAEGGGWERLCKQLSAAKNFTGHMQSLAQAQNKLQCALTTVSTQLVVAQHSDVSEMKISLRELHSTMLKSANISAGIYVGPQNVHVEMQQVTNGLCRIADLPDIDLHNLVSPIIQQYLRTALCGAPYFVGDKGDGRGLVSDDVDSRHWMTTKPEYAVISQDTVSPWYEQSWTKRNVATRTTGRSWSGPFGVIRTQERIIKTYDEEENGERLNLRETLDMDITFTPAPWLSFAAAFLRCFDFRLQGRSISVGLQCINVIPGDSPIWQAVDRCDLSTIRRLFDRGLASPFDRNDNGYTLLHWLMERRFGDKNVDQKDLLSVCRYFVDLGLHLVLAGPNDRTCLPLGVDYPTTMDATHFNSFFHILRLSVDETCLDTDSAWFSLGQVFAGFRSLIKLNWRATVGSLALQITESPQKWCPSSINNLCMYFRSVIDGLFCGDSPDYISAFLDLVRIMGAALLGPNAYLCGDDYSRPILAVVLHLIPPKPDKKSDKESDKELYEELAFQRSRVLELVVGILKVLLEQGTDPKGIVYTFAPKTLLHPVKEDEINPAVFTVTDFARFRGCLDEWKEVLRATGYDVDDVIEYKPDLWTEEPIRDGDGLVVEQALDLGIEGEPMRDGDDLEVEQALDLRMAEAVWSGVTEFVWPVLSSFV